MRNLFLLILLVSVSGCNLFLQPKPMYNRFHGDQLGPEHNQSARAGWSDGCETGYAAYGTHYYKTFYDYKRDPTKVGDKQYEMNWYEGYHFCRQTINTMVNAGVF